MYLCAQLLRGSLGGLTTLSPCAPTGEVHMPSGKTATPEIVDNKDGTVTVRYAPTEVGLHEMHIKYMGSHIPGKSGSAPWLTGPAGLQDSGREHLGGCSQSFSHLLCGFRWQIWECSVGVPAKPNRL